MPRLCFAAPARPPAVCSRRVPRCAPRSPPRRDWPTIPQVYLGGEFAGGCDIMISMHQNGELVDELAKVGHVSTYEGSEE